MLLPEQLQLSFTRSTIFSGRDVAAGPAPRRGRDQVLERKAGDLLRNAGAAGIAEAVIVEWSPRLRSCAGRADFRANRILLNPLLRQHGESEIDRTLRHEVAHLLAHFRAGRRRIRPHGPEWRAACHDLGIGDEQRCHTLPFPVRTRLRPYLYECPKCRRHFPRVRRIRRTVACLACCRAHNKGRFTARFRLQRIETGVKA